MGERERGTGKKWRDGEIEGEPESNLRKRELKAQQHL